ncbi:MAG: glucokinase [Proteobacteria bacterium]|nr:glucokinase [Pseudomonadota bacterium]
MDNTTATAWNLVADIGGTNARIGLQNPVSHELHLVKRYAVARHDRFEDVLVHYLAEIDQQGGWKSLPEKACLAVACPTDSDSVRITNSPWIIDRAKISARLGDIQVELVNDFAAVALAVPGLMPGDWRQIGSGAPDDGRPIAILGPGTGLGVCSLVPSAAGHIVIDGEGGHVDFAPVSQREIAILNELSREFGRVSIERLLSGQGILNIYRALAKLDGLEARLDSPGAISAAALQGADAHAADSLGVFFDVLGSVAGNLALTLGAKGGVYIAGGIVPQLVELAEKSGMRERFESKGRFRTYLENIPVRVVMTEDPGLLGAMKKLQPAGF